MSLNSAGALEFGRGGTTKYGVGASANYLYHWRTTANAGEAAASYYMVVNDQGRVGINNFNLQNPTSPLTVWGQGPEWAIYGIAGLGGIGVHGRGEGTSSIGVQGRVDNGIYAVYGDRVGLATRGGLSHPNYGVHGRGDGGNHGVFGQGFGTNARGVWGITDTGHAGLYGEHTSSGNVTAIATNDAGVRAFGVALGSHGVWGTSNNATGSGVRGAVVTGTNNAGVYGVSTANNGNGIIGEANTGTLAYGVWGRATQGVGGYFQGGQYAIIANGRARVNVIEIIGGSDLAEPFEVTNPDSCDSIEIEPGMVVVIDADRPGQLKLASRAYDRAVAGIISGANGLSPGMVMKSEDHEYTHGSHPVALTGRVWCWCDAGGEPIEPGDMLTTSEVPGHAMKASDRDRRDGAVIGKAMTRLAHGERGLVLVLVNLQ